MRQVVALNAGVAFLDSSDQPAEQLVLAVGGEHVPNDPAAAGAERQAVDVASLREVTVDRVFRRRRLDLRIANGERADPLRGGDIAVEQKWRCRQRGGDVVEAEVAAVVWQQRRDIDVERQQIADRIAILDAVEAMDDVAPRRAARRPAAIERIPEPGREAGVLGSA